MLKAIIRLQPADDDLIRQAADLLTRSFPFALDWQTPEGAQAEVISVLEEGIAFAAVDADGRLLGWIGGLDAYNGHTWELHPLAVEPDRQRQGIGRRLVETLEQAARDAGVMTMMLGTDEEDDRTTLSLVEDLYTDTFAHIAALRNRDDSNPHPFSFYQRLGYQVVGIVPDASAPRKPDIYMAKRLR